MHGTLHGAACRAHMSASAKKLGDGTYIHKGLGAHADFILLYAGFIQKDRHLNPGGIAQLSGNAVQILGCDPLKYNITFSQAADDTSAIHHADALQKGASQNLVLKIAFFKICFIQNIRKRNAFVHQLTCDPHGFG